MGWIVDNAGMATLTLVPVEEYLQRSYEGVDREFVDGVVGERSMPTLLHSKVQGILCGLFFLLSRQFALVVAPELRLALIPGRLYRIPDVCVFVGPGPSDSVPSEPPLVAVEILSPEDRMADMLEKLREYWEFGIANVWMVNPEGRRLYRYDGDGLHPVEELGLVEYEFVVRLDSLGL
jgi:Uma2 family endonuclease